MIFHFNTISIPLITLSLTTGQKCKAFPHLQTHKWIYVLFFLYLYILYDDIYIWSLDNSKFSYNILNLESKTKVDKNLQEMKCKESIKNKIKCKYEKCY